MIIIVTLIGQVKILCLTGEGHSCEDFSLQPCNNFWGTGRELVPRDYPLAEDQETRNNLPHEVLSPIDCACITLPLIILPPIRNYTPPLIDTVID